ncbi:MAG: ribonuclease HII [Deltaproteobacteria bacterium]|nr:ribonuclease HII [Deltaproteobacteria bacterium]
MKQDLWLFENKAYKKGFLKIAGIDEAGRGPLAGPVISAAVILPKTFENNDITDSKKLTGKKREVLYNLIYQKAVSIGIGIVDNISIDNINILQASLLSMLIAVKNLNTRPDFLLIDGAHKINTNICQSPIIKGDSLSISIASASIIAKVTRDRIMEKYHVKYPLYNFDKNKGYPTKKHKEAIAGFGLTPIHRKTFKGVKEHIE